MRILVTIPHYWRSGPDPTQRITALTECLNALKSDEHYIDIFVCTHGASHLLCQLPRGVRFVSQFPADLNSDPMCLGFYCHQKLEYAKLDFDYYCYMEDDLVIRDPQFFNKLAWFSKNYPPECLLLPLRCESAETGKVKKVYVDGPIPIKETCDFQNLSDAPKLDCSICGWPAVEFERATNPHSGCFFLTRQQMQAWAATEYFQSDMRKLAQGERPDCSFMSPLESAATLGIMRTFRIYKPVLDYVGFFEIEHYGTKYLDAFKKNYNLT